MTLPLRYCGVIALFLLLITFAHAVCIMGYVAYVVLHGEDELELRRRLEADDAVQTLRTWVRDRIGAEESLQVGLGDLPVDVKAHGIQDVYSFRSREGQTEYLVIEFGGGMHHYGLLIGRPGFTPIPNKPVWPCRSQWCDQVWYYEE